MKKLNYFVENKAVKVSVKKNIYNSYKKYNCSSHKFQISKNYKKQKTIIDLGTKSKHITHDKTKV